MSSRTYFLLRDLIEIFFYKKQIISGKTISWGKERNIKENFDKKIEADVDVEAEIRVDVWKGIS